MIIPTVIEKTNDGMQAFDIYSRLLKERIIMLNDVIQSHVSSIIIAQLLYLDKVDKNEPIELYINSPGGSVSDGLAIINTMDLVSPEVHTTCVGTAASMAAVILAAGAKGHRFALEDATVLIHQPLGGISGQASDMLIHTEHIIAVRKKLNEKLSKLTGQPIELIATDTDRDKYFTADEAMSYGLIDKVIRKE